MGRAPSRIFAAKPLQRRQGDRRRCRWSLVRRRIDQILGNPLAYGGALVQRKRGKLARRQSATVARQRDADRPGACRGGLGDARLGVVDFDDAPWREDAKIGEAAIHHQRRRPASREIAGADEIVGLVACLRRNRRQARHDVAGVTGRRPDLDAGGAQGRDDRQQAGNEIGVVGDDRRVERDEFPVDRVDVGFAGGRPMRLPPARAATPGSAISAAI